MQAPGENLLLKMWDTLAERGIGGLLRPWRMRREGKASIERRTLGAIAGLVCSLLALPTLCAQSTARVTGLVFDSLTAQPLADALVQLIATNDRARAASARTNARGEFAFDTVATGAYLIGFLHPRLDSLMLAPTSQQIDVTNAGAPLVMLAIPSLETVTTTYCGANAAHDGSAMMLGRLRFTDRDRGTSAGVVRAEWSELTMTARAFSRSPQVASARSGDDGAFVLCGLPREVRVYVRAAIDKDSTPALTLDVPSAGVLLRDVWLSPRASSTRRAQRGVVRSQLRAPITGARLTLRGNSARVKSDINGVFTLPSSPLGTRMLDVDAIGFQSQHVLVDILDDDVHVLDITLPPLITTLATVNVTARAWESAFNARRQKHVASFVDDTTIARRDPLFIADVVRSLPGVRVDGRGSFGARITLGTPRKSCEPNLFVDGVLQRNLTTADVDALVATRDVRAIELYRWGFEVPLQFDAPTSCGALLIWRK